MEEIANIARQYSDVELEVHFESEEDSAETPVAQKAVVPVADPVDRPVSDEEIRADLEKIRLALQQQPFRSSNARGLKRMMSTQPLPAWTELCDPKHPDRVHCDNLTSLRHPAVVTGKLDHWPAREKWSSRAALLKNYPNLSVVATRLVPVGDLGKSQKVIVSLAAYLKYCEETDSDFPLYVFDYDLPSSELRRDYSCPPLPCFEKDLFDPDRYPGYVRESLGYFNKTEWVIIGPKGSGSPLHKDPLYTSAWNALLCGKKYWAVFPPHVELEKLKKRSDLESPMLWFLEELPLLRMDPSLGLIEFWQHAGEVVYLPEGWWHAVLNVDDLCVAVTHNAVIQIDDIFPRLELSHPQFVQYYKELSK